MGATVSLKGNNFQPSDFIKNLHDELQANGLSELTSIGQQIYLETSREPGFPDEFEELWMHPVGGIRGVTVRLDEQGAELSLPSGSGVADWKLASRLATMAVTQGAEVDFDGEPLASSSEGIIDLDEQFKVQWNFDVQVIRDSTSRTDSNHAIELPVGGLIHLQITTDDAASSDLHGMLVDRMAKYSSGYIAQTMMAKQGEGEPITLQVAGAVPTLISGESTLIHARSAAEEEDGGFQRLMKTSDFLEVMAERAEHLGPYIFIPEFDPAADSEVIGRLMETPSFDQAPAPPPIPQDQQTPADFDSSILDRAPALIFIMIAAADGEIDRKEAECFNEILGSFSDLPASMFKGILLRCAHDIKTHIDYYTEGEVSGMLFMVELIALNAAIDNCPEEERQAIRDGLYTLGHRIASASGGGFLGLGSKIDKEEAAALSLIATTLSVDVGSLDL